MDMQMDLNAARPRVLEGGRDIDFDAQEREMWGALADTCQRHLMSIHPLHPRRGEMTAMMSDFRSAAGRQIGPSLELAG